VCLAGIVADLGEVVHLPENLGVRASSSSHRSASTAPAETPRLLIHEEDDLTTRSEEMTRLPVHQARDRLGLIAHRRRAQTGSQRLPAAPRDTPGSYALAAFRAFLVADAFSAAALRLRVAHAFLPASRCFRVDAAFFAASDLFVAML
jgi:hypothetical protein